MDLVTIEHTAHPEILIEPSAHVAFPLSEEDKALIEEMKVMVKTLNGVGLAAPQVGVRKQILVYSISADAKTIRNDSYETIPTTVLINPHYTPTADAQIIYDWEGCFSVLNTTGKVPRYSKITYSAQTPDGNWIHEHAEGFTARVLQHEIDHVQGVLITHRLTPDCIQGHPEEMMALRVQEMSPAQKEAMKKIIIESEKNLDPNDTAKAHRIAQAKRLLEE